MAEEETNTLSKENEYLREILTKYDFIDQIHLTDVDGVGMVSVCKNESDETSELVKNLKINLSCYFNMAVELSSKTEKWNTNNVIALYDNHTILQSRLSKTIYGIFLCSSKGFNQEIVEEIISNLKIKIEKVEKELENMKKELEKEN